MTFIIIASDVLLVACIAFWLAVIRPAQKRDVRRMVEAMQAQFESESTDADDPTDEIALAVAGLEGQRVCPVCQVEAPDEVDEDHGPMWLVAHFMTHDVEA